MSEKKGLSGIQLYKRESTNGGSIFIEYELVPVSSVGKYTLPYITSPVIRAQLNSVHIDTIPSIGRMKFQISSSSKLINIMDYVPVYFSFPQFKKIGVASLAELQILRELRKRFRDYSIRSLDIPSDERSTQYRKRGISDSRNPIPLSEAIERLKRVVRYQNFKNKLYLLNQKPIPTSVWKKHVEDVKRRKLVRE